MSTQFSQERPTRILHFVSTFRVKTDTKWLLQLARHLDPAHHRLSIACFYESGPMQKRFESLGIPTFNLESPHEGDPRAILRAKRLIDRLQPDIVHTHLLRADIFAGTAARWAGIPVILSTVYAVGHFRRSRRRRTDFLLDRVSASLPTHILAVSEAVKRDCIDRLHLEPENVTVVHTGIEPPMQFDPESGRQMRERWRIGPDQPLVVTIARLSYEKGIDTLIDAAAILHQSLPDARFVVVGDGPDERDLQRRIEARSVRGIVQLVGFTDDIWPALLAADVFCMPSKSEGMPNALLEAMAASRPIVANAVGGIPEAISHEANGLLCPPADPRSLADAIRRIISDRPLTARLGNEARTTIESRFLARDVAGRYAALYDRLLKTTRGEHAASAY